MCIPPSCKDCGHEEGPQYYGNDDTDSLEDLINPVITEIEENTAQEHRIRERLRDSTSEDRLHIDSIDEESAGTETAIEETQVYQEISFFDVDLDGLDPDRAIEKLTANFTMDSQWKEIGCETAEDILCHIKTCKCSPDCPVLDCRYFARVPDQWPDRLPDDVEACRLAHGSQLDLLLHASAYGCDCDFGEDCGVLGCRYTIALLVHLKSCQADERCDVPKCWYFRQLRAHWEECIQNFRFCFLCSRYKESCPEPRSHAYLAMFL